MARRIRWLLAFFLRAEPRGAAPGGWALAFDAAVAVGAAAGVVWEAAHRTIGRPIVFPGVPGPPGYPGIPAHVPLHAGFAVLAGASVSMSMLPPLTIATTLPSTPSWSA